MLQERFEDSDEAEAAAHDFVTFCHGRAWVFTDLGSTASGEALYQFTHRTFLEYFTGLFLTRTCDTPEALAELLLPLIKRSEWDVVAQLAFQIKASELDTAANRILTLLIDAADKSRNGPKWNLLSFSARSLEFIVPSPAVARRLATVCIDEAIDWGVTVLASPKAEVREIRTAPRDSVAAGVLGGLLKATDESRPFIADSIKQRITAQLNKGDRKATVALEIGLHLTMTLNYPPRRSVARAELVNEWDNLSREIAKESEKQFVELAEHNQRLAFDALARRLISIDKFIELHGALALFEGRRYLLFPDIWMISPAQLVLGRLTHSVGADPIQSELDSIHDLKQISRMLPNQALPWVGRASHTYHPWWPQWLFDDELPGISWPSLEGDAAFGAILLSAAIVESVSTRDPEHRRLGTTSDKVPFARILRARFSKSSLDSARSDMEKLGLDASQSALLVDWIEKKINLAEPSAKARRPSRKATKKGPSKSARAR